MTTESNNSKTIAEYIANGMSANEHCHNFYDWFCKDTSLAAKARGLDTKLKMIIASPRFNVDVNTWRCYYKNNCPMTGRLYDFIGISPNGDGEFFVITPKSGHYSHNGKGSVWSSVHHEIFEGTWKEIKEWIKG